METADEKAGWSCGNEKKNRGMRSPIYLLCLHRTGKKQASCCENLSCRSKRGTDSTLLAKCGVHPRRASQTLVIICDCAALVSCEVRSVSLQKVALCRIVPRQLDTKT